MKIKRKKKKKRQSKNLQTFNENMDRNKINSKKN